MEYPSCPPRLARGIATTAGEPSRRPLPAPHARGQALVEFALVLPLVIVLIVGAIELARYVAVHTATASASRDAARYGSTVGEIVGGSHRYVDCEGIRDAAFRASPLVTLANEDIAISYEDGAGVAVTDECPPHGAGPIEADIARGDRIVVVVSTHYQPLLPFLPGFDLVSADRRTIFRGD